jgi:hypothetical protein
MVDLFVKIACFFKKVSVLKATDLLVIHGGQPYCSFLLSKDSLIRAILKRKNNVKALRSC